MHKKPTVTIAIPAYNEGANIGNLIDLLEKQDYKKVALDKVVVYTDGSTDDTVRIVNEKIKEFPGIELIAGKTQKGKFYRLNQIYKDNKSDVLIVLDADIAIRQADFVEKFALALTNDPGAMMASAHELPIRPDNFIGRVIAHTYIMWDFVRWSVPNYDHVQNIYARATAYRGTFAKTLHIPEEATEERLYLYLMAKKVNGFRYVLDAQIYYLPVSTIYDYIKLSERAFGRPQPAVNKLVGYDATYHYEIPRKYTVRGIMVSFLHNPFYTSLAFLLGLWLSKTVLSRKTADSPLWEVSLSSKKKISI